MVSIITHKYDSALAQAKSSTLLPFLSIIDTDLLHTVRIASSGTKSEK